MKHALLMGTVAALFVTAGVAAQGRNFAGTWTIDAEKTMAAGGGGGARGGFAGAGGGGGGVIVAAGGEQRAVAGAGGGGARGGGGGAVARSGGAGGAVMASPGMTLTIDANSFTIAQGQTTTSYSTDGSVTNLDNTVRRASAKAAWQGDKLVIDTTTDTPNGPVVTQATWYLEGESLVRENKSAGADGTEVVRKTYFKKAPQH